jgi:phage gp36-like protein
MTYALATDIANEFRFIEFNNETDPELKSDISLARVNTFLDEADAEINLCLNNKYITPITGTESLKVLKRIEIAIVSSRVASLIDLKQFTNQSKTIKQEFNKSNYAENARKLLQELKDEKLTLVDAELIDTDYGMTSSLECDSTAEPIWKKRVEQW